jgi:hypothetical protein
MRAVKDPHFTTGEGDFQPIVVPGHNISNSWIHNAPQWLDSGRLLPTDRELPILHEIGPTAISANPGIPKFPLAYKDSWLGELPDREIWAKQTKREIYLFGPCRYNGWFVPSEK